MLCSRQLDDGRECLLFFSLLMLGLFVDLLLFTLLLALLFTLGRAPLFLCTLLGFRPARLSPAWLYSRAP